MFLRQEAASVTAMPDFATIKQLSDWVKVFIPKFLKNDLILTLLLEWQLRPTDSEAWLEVQKIFRDVEITLLFCLDTLNQFDPIRTDKFAAEINAYIQKAEAILQVRGSFEPSIDGKTGRIKVCETASTLQAETVFKYLDLDQLVVAYHDLGKADKKIKHSQALSLQLLIALNAIAAKTRYVEQAIQARVVTTTPAVRKKLKSPDQLAEFADFELLQKWILATFPDFFALGFISKELIDCGQKYLNLIRNDWLSLQKIFQGIEIALLFSLNALEQIMDAKTTGQVKNFEYHAERAEDILLVYGRYIAIDDNNARFDTFLKEAGETEHLQIIEEYISINDFLKLSSKIVGASLIGESDSLARQTAEKVVMGLEAVGLKLESCKDALEYNAAAPDTHEGTVAKITGVCNAPEYNDKYNFLNTKKINAKFQALRQTTKDNFCQDTIVKTAILFYELQVANNYIGLALLATVHLHRDKHLINDDVLAILKLIVNKKDQYEFSKVENLIFQQHINLEDLAKFLNKVALVKPSERFKYTTKIRGGLDNFQLYICDIFNREHHTIQDQIIFGSNGLSTLASLNESYVKLIHHFQEEQRTQRAARKRLISEAKQATEEKKVKVTSSTKVTPASAAAAALQPTSTPATNTAPVSPKKAEQKVGAQATSSNGTSNITASSSSKGKPNTTTSSSKEPEIIAPLSPAALFKIISGQCQDHIADINKQLPGLLERQAKLFSNKLLNSNRDFEELWIKVTVCGPLLKKISQDFAAIKILSVTANAETLVGYRDELIAIKKSLGEIKHQLPDFEKRVQFYENNPGKRYGSLPQCKASSTGTAHLRQPLAEQKQPAAQMLNDEDKLEQCLKDKEQSLLEMIDEDPESQILALAAHDQLLLDIMDAEYPALEETSEPLPAIPLPEISVAQLHPTFFYSNPFVIPASPTQQPALSFKKE